MKEIRPWVIQNAEAIWSKILLDSRMDLQVSVFGIVHSFVKADRKVDLADKEPEFDPEAETQKWLIAKQIVRE